MPSYRPHLPELEWAFSASYFAQCCEGALPNLLVPLAVGVGGAGCFYVVAALVAASGVQ